MSTFADVREVLDTAERLAARVQRAVGEEGDVFDFAAPERMAQADALSAELLPLAETVLQADVLTVIDDPNGPLARAIDLAETARDVHGEVDLGGTLDELLVVLRGMR